MAAPRVRRDAVHPVVALAVLLAVLVPGRAAAADLWVNPTAGCSDARTTAEATASDRAWCTLARATPVARAGDTVHIRPGTYGPVRFDASGTPAQPIRFVAEEPGVVVNGTGATQALKLMDVSDVELAGITARGGSAQAIWVQNGARVKLTGLQIAASAGAGITIKGAAGLTLQQSTISGNQSAGVLELAGTRDARYVGNTISANGTGASAYNGDGIQLGGTGAAVADSTITGNGSSQYEHGVYTAATSSGWRIERNTLTGNAGANIKAAGTGVVRRNRLTDGRYGLVASDNAAPLLVEHNVIEGRAQHLVFFTQGTAAARARLLANTVVQTGRATSTGDASAVFVNAAAELELRDNLLAYAGADNAGVALWVNDPARLGTLTSDTNWFTAVDGKSRHLAWAGSRTTLAGWRAVTTEDARSLSSWAPKFDAARRVISTNWGIDRGVALGLPEDFSGRPLPPIGIVDVGAYEGGP